MFLEGKKEEVEEKKTRNVWGGCSRRGKVALLLCAMVVGVEVKKEAEGEGRRLMGKSKQECRQKGAREKPKHGPLF